MKKLLALVMAVLMLALMVAGCGSSDSQLADASKPAVDVEPMEKPTGFTFPSLPEPEETEVTETLDPEETIPPVELENLGAIAPNTKLQNKDMKYVMVYNPAIYNENLEENISLSAGNVDKQIVVDMERADGLQEIPEILPYSVSDLNPQKFELQPEMNRAEVLTYLYKKGDKEVFYTYADDDMAKPRQQREFTCAYAGEYCNIWVYNKTISDADAKVCGEEFDTNLYTQLIEKFGEPRYSSKVNFLYYPMQDGIMGGFCGLDAFLEPEVAALGFEDYGCNTGVNLLHMNSRYGATNEDAIATIVHEFQHMLCFANAFYTKTFAQNDTWFNEAMSGYVEEYFYPGIQQHAGRMEQYMRSNLIRHGQSLYNFTTALEDYDIGVYGSVHLYSQYLVSLFGDNVFTNFYYYWRNSMSETLCDSEALAYAVPEELYDAVDLSVTYPEAFKDLFVNEEDAWMSKLTLQFYLDVLDLDLSDPIDFLEVDPAMLAYDQLEAPMIEGGGRVILALKGNSYEIPTLADKGLIYVGLDADFNVLSVCYN